MHTISVKVFISLHFFFAFVIRKSFSMLSTVIHLDYILSFQTFKDLTPFAIYFRVSDMR